MQTIGVNLVPLERRQAKRRRARSRYWASACAVYTLGWVAAWGIGQLGVGSDDCALPRKHATALSFVKGTSAEVTTLRGDLDRTMAELRAENAVGRQPDWSVLLALLSRTLGEKIVLRKVVLDGLPPARPAAGAAAPPPALGLEFSGLAQSQADVSRYVLRLEKIPLFQSVKLLNTRREPFMAGSVVAFSVECVLDGGGEPARGGPAP